MIIVYIKGGIGNQLFQYAAGRRLSHKLNTELKLDTTFYERDNLRPYALNLFNIKESFATPEEIDRVKSLKESIKIDIEKFMPEVLDYPDNMWLNGYWQYEEYFADIADILRKEFTLRQPLGETAKRYEKKILSAKCSVSLHVRHGDFIYSPINVTMQNHFAILPLDYYYDCVNNLKQQYGALQLFVFSDNLNWCKENLHAGVPTEFISGCDADVEELYLMSICKHNVISKSTFSWWGAWLNQNPDKKVFMPMPIQNDDSKKSYLSKENSPLDSDKWIKVPFDLNNQVSITMRPYFSLLLVVNDDVATLNETLGSILTQDYKYYELIIIDNASTDGSGKICRQITQSHDNVTLIKLWKKVSNGAAWNKALNLAQGNFVLFIKGNDRMLVNALTSMYLVNEHALADVVNSVVWLRENERGNIDMAGRKFGFEIDAAFQGLQDSVRVKFDKPTLLKILANNGGSTPIGTKIFKRKFLMENGIAFNDKTGNDAEFLFIINAMFQAEENIFVANPFYIAPRK